MGQGPGRGIEQAEAFVLDGVEFVPSWARPSQPGSFTVQKAARMVDAYRRLVAPYPAPRMVELGVFQGGSVAMLALLARPRRFVAIEYSDRPIPALQAFLSERELDDVVQVHHGIDQADRPRLEAIIEASFGFDPLDLVIDDASHRYAETVASFEVLFPRLAPGGRYVIEDWTCGDTLGAAMVEGLARADPEIEAKLVEALEAKSHETADGPVRMEQPLSRMAAELVLARAVSGDAVAEVRADEDWLEVVRGPAPLDPATFRYRDLVPDHFSVLTTVPEDLLAHREPPKAAADVAAWWAPPA